jgi:hypothetical protein
VSERRERACTECGSPLHHEIECLRAELVRAEMDADGLRDALHRAAHARATWRARAARWKALARRLRRDVLRVIHLSQLAQERWQFWMKAADTESEVADKAHKGWAQCREQLAAAECNLLEATEEWDSHCNSLVRARFADSWVGIGWAYMAHCIAIDSATEHVRSKAGGEGT